MKNPQISIIVPVYKAEQFLNKCVDSILSQSQSDFELILVEDGSPDNSGAICDEYARQDSRVRVIHQKNAGVSAARNRGIREASGIYIGFVDADDWVDANMYGQMICTAESFDVDIVMCDALTVYESGATSVDTIQHLSQDCILHKEDMHPELMLEFAGTVWRCIYRTDMIRQRNIFFPEGLKFSEDRIFNIYAMGYANGIVYLKKPFYMYYMNQESCVHRFHYDFYFHAKNACARVREAIATAWDDREDFQREYLRQFIYHASLTVDNARRDDVSLSVVERIRMIREVCTDRELCAAMDKTGYYGPWGKWIRRKWVLPLCFYRGWIMQKTENFLELLEGEGWRGIIRKCIGKLRHNVHGG